MKDLKILLAKAIQSAVQNDGVQASPVNGVRCAKVSQNGSRSKQHWHATLAIVVQGCKEIVLGHEVYRCEEAMYIATPLDLPVTSRVLNSSPTKPFLCIMIDFDSKILSELEAQLGDLAPRKAEATSRGFFLGKADDRMLEAALRMMRLFKSKDDATVIGPLITKELFYHLLKGASGAAIRQFVLSGSKTQKISKAIYSLRTDLSEEIDVASLAKRANMSRSAFFKQFKEVTAMSPIQYQKKLRLLEARRLMIEDGETAERSAFKVGYNSASQFSREYSRMFGTSPLRDALKIKLDSTARSLSKS